MRFWMIIVALGALVAALAWRFPYVMGTGAPDMQILYLVLTILLIAGGGGMTRRMTGSQALRDALLWLAIILVIALGYSYRNDLKGTRLYGALVPSSVRVTQEGALQVRLRQDGHFHLEAEINGALVSCMIDTGASDIVLSPRAAIAAGFDPETLNYTRAYQTANGSGSGAPVKLDALAVGNITLHDVPASVNSADMDESLLGMAFLNRFRSFSVDGDTLTLYP